MAYVEGQPFDLKDGHGDPFLSERGLWQADQVGTRLANEPISAMYASTLTRTQQTAAPLAGALGLTPRIDARLREIYLGEFEGGLFREMSAQNHPAVAAFRESQEWGEIPGAETNEVFQSRVVEAVTEIAAAHADEVVGVFCHGGVIAALMAYALGRNDFAFMGARNASLSFLSVGPDRWTVRLFNDASHTGSLTIDDDPII